MAGQEFSHQAAFDYSPAHGGVRWQHGLCSSSAAGFEAAVRVRQVRDALDSCLSSGETVGVLADVEALQDERRLVMVVAVRGNGPTPTVIGHVVDVTRQWQRDVSQRANVQIQEMLATRPAIDQAKGALMHVYGIDEEQAFLTLARCSQHTNIKVRDLADRLLQGFTNHDGANPVLALLEPYSPAAQDDQLVPMGRAVGQ